MLVCGKVRVGGDRMEDGGVSKAGAAWVRKCRIMKSSEAVTNGCVERKLRRRCVGVPREGAGVNATRMESEVRTTGRSSHVRASL